jgi:hypothetical protein
MYIKFKPQVALNPLVTLVSTLLHATVYIYTQFAECTVQIANKIGLKKSNNGAAAFRVRV